MKTLLHLSIACLTLIGCKDKQYADAKSNNEVAKPSPMEAVAEMGAPASWRRNRDLFDAHLSAVEGGWSIERLIAHAGEPDISINDGRQWSYRWEEDRVHGGQFSVYTFLFKGGRVANIESSSGHLTKRAPDQ